MATAERFVAAFKEAGLPGGVFQSLAVNHTTAALVMKQPSVQFISFTGSLRGGITISETLSHKFIKSVYELGGKDPSYLREDVDLNYAIEPLLFMTMYNSGQCCFGTERIYVHEAVYDEFIARVTEGIKVNSVGELGFHDITF